MKKLVIAVAFATLATSAVAGSIAGPVVEPEVVVQQASTSSVNQHILPPALFVLSVAASLLLF